MSIPYNSFPEVPQKFSLSYNLSLLSEEQRAPLVDKLDKLVLLLKTKYNMNLRDDSRLVWAYLTTLPETELENTCKELWYTKLLYEYTKYPQSLKALPQIKYNLMYPHSWYPLASQRAWEHIQNFVLPVMQLECIYESMEKSGMLQTYSDKNV